MRKKKRFVAILLSLLMMFSLCSNAIYAEDDSITSSDSAVVENVEETDEDTVETTNDETDVIVSDEADTIDEETSTTDVTTTTDDTNSSVSVASSNSSISVAATDDSNDGIAVAAEDGDYIANGTCGSNLTWTLDSDYNLVISGTGEMTTYENWKKVPWYSDYSSLITTVTVEEGVTSISQYAFYGCSNLTEVDLADTVSTIGMYAFNNCKSLSSITMNGVTSIGGYSFNGCTSLNTDLPDSLQSIGNKAFSGCTSLTAITIPESVTSLGNYAFSGCTGLTNITINAEITSLNGAFKDCSNLTSIDLPDSITSIADYEFSGWTSLTSITLSNKITSIGNYAFQNCTSLTSITLPTSLTSIGNYAFDGCTGLTGVIWPNSVISMSNSVFSGCTNLVSITLPDTLTSIGISAFSGCTNLASITLPDTLTSIGSSAFSECTNLISITLPENITEIANSTFKSCTNLESVIVNGTITSIGQYAFDGDTNLSTIPDLSNVTEMGTYAFRNCSLLTGVIDLSSLDSIPNYAFYGCKYITGIIFSESLTSIGNRAFCGCNRIESLDFPNTLISIGEYAFYNNWLLGNNITTTVESGATVTDVLTSTTTTLSEDASYTGYTLVIPDSVTSIGKYAFQYSYVYVFDIGSGLTEVDATAFASYYVNAVIFDNIEDNINITNLESIDDKKKNSSDTLVIYRQGTIGDVGDTISDEEGAMTLQEAVNAVAAGTYEENGEITNTITIKKNIKLSATLNVPKNFSGTITTDDGSYILIADSNANVSKLINIVEGAELTLEGNLTISGINNSSSIIYCQGLLTMNDNVTITRGTINDLRLGVVDINGSNAKFTMNGGTIENNTITNWYSGSVRISEGAEFYMNDGTICNNKSTLIAKDANGRYSMVTPTTSGILLYEDSYAEMNGGTITGNYSFDGSAIMVYSLQSDSTAKFVLNDGLIDSNTSIKGAAYSGASGAIYVEGYVEFIMNDGTISNNYGYNGGAITINGSGGEYPTTFTMNGGTIENNSAYNGGGIYSYSDCTTLNAGVIQNNEAFANGGGVYCEGNTTAYSTIQLYNVAVYENEAEQGGGIWICPTGQINVYVTNGGIIYNNIGTGAADDLAFANGYSSTIKLSDRTLGGGKVYWYEDGNIHNSVNTTVVDNDSSRFDESDRTLIATESVMTKTVCAKTEIGDEAVTLAKDMAELIITGNTAVRGGGIGSNGGVDIGEKDTTEVTITKTWNHGDNAEENYPDSITLNLYNGDSKIETITLTKNDATINDDGSWTYTFTDLPTDGIYSVTEEDIKYYNSVVNENNGNTIEIINTYEGSNLSITKEVTGSGDTTKEFNFTITLSGEINGTYSDVIFKDGVANVTLKDGETITIKGLPAGLDYEVQEIEANQGAYITTVTNNTGTLVKDETAEVKFTNDLETISISGTKTWDDANNQDGKRPESITVRLLVDGEEIDNQTVTADDNWSYTFENLPKYSNVKEIEYVVTEDAVENYSTTYDGYNITNSYTPEKTSITVVKAWDDSNDKDGIRPESVTVTLLKNGEATDQTIILNADNNWEASFTDLDVYSNGVAIEYSVEEVSVDGYTSEITGSMSEGFVITNTHTPIETTTTPTNPTTPTTTTSETTPTETVETTVKTGDNVNIALYAFILVIAMIGIVTIRKTYKKKQ